MAILTILFLDRYRSSTGLPALVPGVFPLGFLPLPCVRFSLPLFPTPVLQVPAISGFSPSFVYLRSMVFWYGLCFPPAGFGSVFPSFPPRFLPLPCVRLSPRWFYCCLLVHRRFDISPFTFRISVLPLRLCGSVVVARGWPEGLPHHSPGAAKSTGQAAAIKPFVISAQYSGN